MASGGKDSGSGSDRDGGLPDGFFQSTMAEDNVDDGGPYTPSLFSSHSSSVSSHASVSPSGRSSPSSGATLSLFSSVCSRTSDLESLGSSVSLSRSFIFDRHSCRQVMWASEDFYPMDYIRGLHSRNSSSLSALSCTSLSPSRHLADVRNPIAIQSPFPVTAHYVHSLPSPPSTLRRCSSLPDCRDRPMPEPTQDPSFFSYVCHVCYNPLRLHNVPCMEW